MGLLFSQPVRVFYSQKPAEFLVHGSKAPLSTLVQLECPSLFKDFRPPWWLFNGHLQTLYAAMGNFTEENVLTYKRTYLRLMDGGTLSLDFTENASNTADDVPIIVVLHGLTGGSHESYVRAILSPISKSVQEGGLGYRGVVINFRGCAGTAVTSQQLYSAGHTDDVRQALAYLAFEYPHAPLIGVGFSLGANVLVRYLAEEKDESRLLTGCVFGCPWDLLKSCNKLKATPIGRVYAKAMGQNLVRLLNKHVSALSKYPDHPCTQAMVSTLSIKSITLDKFDDTFTRVAGGSPPTFPFPSGEAYYNWASSHYVLPDVAVPLLAVNSADDPVVAEVPIALGTSNPCVIVALTGGGGHLGWFESSAWGRQSRWMTKPALEWIRLSVGLVQSDGKQLRTLYRTEAGFIVEAGKDGLGCQVIEAGKILDSTQVVDSGMIQGL